MKNNGGPAFPRSSQGPMGDLDRSEGMTLRDYFAAQAMHGLVSSQRNHHFADAVEVTIREAYEYADAMIAERDK